MKPILHAGDKVAIVCNSNGNSTERKEINNRLDSTLREMGLVPVWSEHIYAEHDVFSCSGKRRAEIMNSFYKDDDIKAIFDVSGGDIANGVLEYLDYDLIKNTDKLFVGYSDLSTVINALYTKSGKQSCLYQVRHILNKPQKQIFYDTFFEGNESLFNAKYRFLKGSTISGTVLGGNIRCTLKLAGTPYFPDMTDKLLFIEALGCTPGSMYTLLNQHRQMGTFGKIKGLLLGQFTEMEREKSTPTIEDLVLEATEGYDFPIAKTDEIGHSQDSKAIIIGSEVNI